MLLSIDDSLQFEINDLNPQSSVPNDTHVPRSLCDSIIQLGMHQTDLLAVTRKQVIDNAHALDSWASDFLSARLSLCQ